MVAGMVVVATASGAAAKMTPDDAKKVEQAGGKPAEQMTEEELDAAAQKAGVTLQEADDKDVAELEK
jgi:hypothetical protein